MLVSYTPEPRSSMLCSVCEGRVSGLSEVGTRGALTGVRKASYDVMKCQQCGLIMNRDCNAAYNIAMLGLRLLQGLLPPRRFRIKRLENLRSKLRSWWRRGS